MLDLTKAVVVVPKGLSGPESKAVAMLVEEVERRTQVRWKVDQGWPEDGSPVVAVGTSAALGSFAGTLCPAARGGPR